MYISSSSCRAASTDFPNSLAIRHYHPSLLAGLPGYIQCPYKAVLVGRPTLVRLCEGVHRRRALLSSSLLLKVYRMSYSSNLDGL